MSKSYSEIKREYVEEYKNASDPEYRIILKELINQYGILEEEELKQNLHTMKQKYNLFLAQVITIGILSLTAIIFGGYNAKQPADAVIDIFGITLQSNSFGIALIFIGIIGAFIVFKNINKYTKESSNNDG